MALSSADLSHPGTVINLAMRGAGVTKIRSHACQTDEAAYLFDSSVGITL
jgi:hypothetical protein